jgi:hypothetical protein
MKYRLIATAVQATPVTKMAPIAPMLGVRLRGASKRNARGIKIAAPKTIWPVAIAGGAI